MIDDWSEPCKVSCSGVALTRLRRYLTTKVASFAKYSQHLLSCSD
jgi:hypothetical protein